MPHRTKTQRLKAERTPALASANCYDAWLLEVKRIGQMLGWNKRALDSIDVEAWKLYYDDDYTPAEAWYEEYCAAS